ncbi:hypothetical protein CBOM_01086 [Ceraceosorus bombacis]|uniref:Uncharacterized protein n=1 Tax=Ceraceosorus bombacis TaxID=401625 RepID=A0A0P1BBJ6_9BASI|nr:hypothetical protein CBOM_01086 [Ceraceosorus bombacis]
MSQSLDLQEQARSPRSFRRIVYQRSNTESNAMLQAAIVGAFAGNLAYAVSFVSSCVLGPPVGLKPCDLGLLQAVVDMWAYRPLAEVQAKLDGYAHKVYPGAEVFLREVPVSEGDALFDSRFCHTPRQGVATPRARISELSTSDLTDERAENEGSSGEASSRNGEAYSHFANTVPSVISDELPGETIDTATGAAEMVGRVQELPNRESQQAEASTIQELDEPEIGPMPSQSKGKGRLVIPDAPLDTAEVEDAAVEAASTSAAPIQEAQLLRSAHRQNPHPAICISVHLPQDAQPESSYNSGTRSFNEPSCSALELSREQRWHENDGQDARRRRLIWLSETRDQERLRAAVVRYLPSAVAISFDNEANDHVRAYFAERFSRLLERYLQYQQSLGADLQTLEPRIDQIFIEFVETAVILTWRQLPHISASVRCYRFGRFLGHVWYMSGFALAASKSFGADLALLDTELLGLAALVFWMVDWSRRDRASMQTPSPEGLRTAASFDDLMSKVEFRRMFGSIFDERIIIAMWDNIEAELPRIEINNNTEIIALLCAVGSPAGLQHFVRQGECIAAGAIDECNDLRRVLTSSLPRLWQDAAAPGVEAQD